MLYIVISELRSTLFATVTCGTVSSCSLLASPWTPTMFRMAIAPNAIAMAMTSPNPTPIFAASFRFFMFLLLSGVSSPAQGRFFLRSFKAARNLVHLFSAQDPVHVDHQDEPVARLSHRRNEIP